MKKKHLYFFQIIMLLVLNANAQTKNITGKIKDEKGNPVSFATIQVKETSDVTVADSMGLFALSVKPGTAISVKAAGFNDTTFVTNGDFINIILKRSENTLNPVTVKGYIQGNSVNSQFIGNALQDYAMFQNLTDVGLNHTATISLTGGGGTHVGQVVNTWNMQSSGTLYTGSSIPVFSHKEETRGSRYFFDKWVKGVIINSEDTVVNNASFKYNYDKISGNILFTQDGQQVIEVDKAKMNGFVLYDDGDKNYIFEKMPLIDSTTNRFFQVLSAGNKYLLFKSASAKFVKSDYHTDGMTSTGNPYDEFVDDNNYYLINVGNLSSQKIDFKKKNIKQIFIADDSKMNEYFSAHKEDVINEDFLRGLVDYLNK